MSIAGLIRKRPSGKSATATPAIPATQGLAATIAVARIATIAVANPSPTETGPDLSFEIEPGESWALDVLTAHPEARYGVHVDTTGDQVRVTVVIRGAALCEVWIPASRWDGVRFLELLEQFGGTVDATKRAMH